MKKVFIITEGSYSDYHICSIFSTREKANDFISCFKKNYDEMTIEEWEVNPYTYDLKNLTPYFVRMNKSGDTLEVYIEELSYGFSSRNEIDFDINNNIYLHVFAKDETHAIKITNEKRAQLIANNQWR